MQPAFQATESTGARMFGYLSVEQRGAGDRLLAEVADRLEQRGVRLAGVVQINTETDPDRPCLMELRHLPGGGLIRISQDLGAFSQGCRLDQAQLETAVGRVAAAMRDCRPDLVLLNKFGKAEAEGRGFRPLIGQALEEGIPVLTHVAPKNLVAFQQFAQGMALPLEAREADVMAWCLSLLNPAPTQVTA